MMCCLGATPFQYDPTLKLHEQRNFDPFTCEVLAAVEVELLDWHVLEHPDIA